MGKAATNRELSGLTMELSLLLRAGVGVGDALSMLGGEDGYQDLLAGMAQRADEGAPLSECLRTGGRVPAYVCGLIEVGEETGRTEEALSALSQYYEQRARLDRQVRSALLYPAVMLVLMLVVIGVLLVQVLPIFDDVCPCCGCCWPWWWWALARSPGWRASGQRCSPCGGAPGGTGAFPAG